MSCPKCNKPSYCGCGSCKKRKGMHPLRSSIMRGDYVKCPYCHTDFHADYWETWEIDKQIKKELETKTD